MFWGRWASQSSTRVPLVLGLSWRADASLDSHACLASVIVSLGLVSLQMAEH